MTQQKPSLRKRAEFDNDADWLKHIATLTDPCDLLDELVELDDAVFGIGDPYYQDLYGAIINRARELGHAT